MERSVVLLHHGALAHFQVLSTDNGGYIARLQKYQGSREQGPPEQFELHKVGRHWEDEGFDQELADEIGKAIEISQRTEEGPVDLERARRWGGAPESF